MRADSRRDTAHRPTEHGNVCRHGARAAVVGVCGGRQGEAGDEEQQQMAAGNQDRHREEDESETTDSISPRRRAPHIPLAWPRHGGGLQPQLSGS